MIDCPSCKSQAFVGSFFCMDCGEALVDIPDRSTGDQKQLPEPIAQEDQIFDGSELTALKADVRFGFRVMTTGDAISLQGRSNFTLGHAVSGQAVVPDVDLGPYDAEVHGISRIHAELLMGGSAVMVIDLESSNGTKVNETALEPHKPYRLHHGDTLQLGTLRLQMLIRD